MRPSAVNTACATGASVRTPAKRDDVRPAANADRVSSPGKIAAAASSNRTAPAGSVPRTAAACATSWRAVVASCWSRVVRHSTVVTPAATSVITSSAARTLVARRRPRRSRRSEARRNASAVGPSGIRPARTAVGAQRSRRRGARACLLREVIVAPTFSSAAASWSPVHSGPPVSAHAVAAASTCWRAASMGRTPAIASRSGSHAARNCSWVTAMWTTPSSRRSVVSRFRSTNGVSSRTTRSGKVAMSIRRRVGSRSMSTVTSCSSAPSTSSRLRPVSRRACANAASACLRSAPRTPPMAAYRSAESSPPQPTPSASSDRVKASNGRASPSPVSSTRRATSSSLTAIPALRAGSSITWRSASRPSARTGTGSATARRRSSKILSMYSERSVASTRTGPSAADRSTSRKFPRSG